MCQNGSGLKFSIQTPAAPLVLEDEYVPTVRTYVRTYMTCKMLAAHVYSTLVARPTLVLALVGTT